MVKPLKFWYFAALAWVRSPIYFIVKFEILHQNKPTVKPGEWYLDVKIDTRDQIQETFSITVCRKP